MIWLNAETGVAAEGSRRLLQKAKPVGHNLFTLEHVVRGRVDQTYPLALLARPRLTLEGWRSYCGRRSALRGAGLLLAIDPGDCVRGLSSYAGPASASAGVLDVDIFVVAHVFDPQPIVMEMLDELERLAIAAGCRIIEFAPQDFQALPQRVTSGRGIALRPNNKLGG